MKTLKGWLTGGILAAMLLLGSATAKADGIIFGFAGDTAADDSACTNDNGGIIFGSTGIIFGATGIIFGATDDSSGCSNNLTRNGLLISD